MQKSQLVTNPRTIVIEIELKGIPEQRLRLPQDAIENSAKYHKYTNREPEVKGIPGIEEGMEVDQLVTSYEVIDDNGSSHVTKDTYVAEGFSDTSRTKISCI